MVFCRLSSWFVTSSTTCAVKNKELMLLDTWNRLTLVSRVRLSAARLVGCGNHNKAIKSG